MQMSLFDTHCDTITKPMPLRRNAGHLDLERLAAYSPSAQVFAVWSLPAFEGPVAYSAIIRRLHAQLGKNQDTVRLCTSAADAEAAAKEGKTAAFISVEGAGMLGCSIDGLHRAYEDGVRIIHLTWNKDNALAGAAMDGQGGLTPSGREFLLEAQRMGMAVDMSHISEKAFWDAVDITTKPLLAGHSNSKALCPHRRNLTDEQFTALVKIRGCAGLNMCPEFLGDDPDVEMAVDHAEHFLALGGEKCVCIGADLDGISSLPRGLRGVQDLGKIYEAMLRRGWSEDLIRDIFYGNAFDFFGRTL